jgi:hypothetical protein
MKKPISLFFGLAFGLFGMTGCEKSENQAKPVLEKFEHVFQVCKEETLKKQLEPGKHICSKVSSIAIDKTLRDTGMGEGELAKARDEWVELKGFKGYYLPEDER